MQKFFKWLDTRIADYADARDRGVKAHQTRLRNAIAARNNGDLPLETEQDGAIRFRAPYDGYVHFWVKGDEEFEATFLGGQYLPQCSKGIAYESFGIGGHATEIQNVPAERAKKFVKTFDGERIGSGAVSVTHGRVYENRKTGEAQCYVRISKCPEDIYRAIDNYLMGDIYRLQFIAEQKEQAERKARDLAHENGENVAEGRQVITGVVLAFKRQESQFGTVLKMLVQDDRGFRVWGSVPGKLDAMREDRIKFTATVEASDRDAKFGFFKRPAKAINLTEEAA